VEIICTEFYPHRSRIQELLVEICLYPWLKNDRHEADFHKSHAYSTIFLKKFNTEFHRSPARDLVADTRS